MKKAATITLISLLLLLSCLIPVLAQNFNYEKAYQDYQYSLQTYNDSLEDYRNAKDSYLKNTTLTLKEDARKKTLKLLNDRDKLQIVHLTAIRMKIVETKGIDTIDKNTIFGLIDSEVLWYKNHEETYKETDPLEDLFNKSDESKSRYDSDTLPLIYESLFLISLGEAKGIREDSEMEYSSLKSVINTGVSEGRLNMNPFNRWLTDIDSVIQNLKKNEAESKIPIAKIRTQRYSMANSYDSGIEVLATSSKLLSQLNNFLTEVLTSIKNQQ